MKKLFAFLLVLMFCFCSVLPAFAEGEKAPLKVLAIGHSYAVNSTEYIWSIANQMGENIEIHTLYHAGCSIKRHVENYETGRLDYYLYKNGKTDFEYVDIKSVLKAKQYDVITFQESPEGSVSFTSYKDDLGKLQSYVRKHQPNAQFMIHQTWAFSVETLRGEGDYGTPGYGTSKEHFADIEDAYNSAAEFLGGVKIIKSGQAVELAKDAFNFGAAIKDNESLYADTISHLSDIGKYLTACVWVETLLGKDVRTTEFLLGVPRVEVLREIAHETVTGEQSTVFDGLRVLENEKGYTLIKDYREIGEDGVVEIPAYVNGKPITVLDDKVYKDVNGIKQIIIPRSIKSFNSGAYFGFNVKFVDAKKPPVAFYKSVWFYLALGGAVILAVTATLILIKKRKGV